MLKNFDGKRTRYEGLWRCADDAFVSATFNLSWLKEYKGNVKFFIMKNKFYKQNSRRPEYVFTIIDSKMTKCKDMDLEDEASEEEERMYTYDEVRRIMDGVARDVMSGYGADDLLIEDYVD